MDCYDPDSGLVFRETVVKATHVSRTRPAPYLSENGVDPLKAMATRKIVYNAIALQPETLKEVPQHILKEIFMAIRRNGRETVETWKCFVEAGYGDRSFLHGLTRTRYRNKPLVDHFLDLTSSRIAWMTDLTLRDVYCSRADLKQLALISNLQNLQVQYSSGSDWEQEREPFNDAVMGHLAWCAETNGSFRQLRMIFVKNAPGISPKSLEVLSSFPSLDTLCVFATRIKKRHGPRSAQHGWNINLDFQTSSLSHGKHHRTKYNSIFSTPPRLNETIDRYIQKRRSDTPQGPRNVPIISAVFGDLAPELTRREDLDDMLCFERDWRFTSPNITTKTCAVASRLTDDTLEGRPAPKKRKLKHGKALALDAVLDGL